MSELGAPGAAAWEATPGGGSTLLLPCFAEPPAEIGDVVLAKSQPGAKGRGWRTHQQGKIRCCRVHEIETSIHWMFLVLISKVKYSDSDDWV
jgi:hypothetical protein